MSARPPRPEADARADYPSIYQPTPYDVYLTDDPEATWDEIQAESGPEADVLLCPAADSYFPPRPAPEPPGTRCGARLIYRQTEKGTTCEHSQHPTRTRALRDHRRGR